MAIAAPPASLAGCAWHAAEDLLPCHACYQPNRLCTACCWWLHAPGCLAFHACCSYSIAFLQAACPSAAGEPDHLDIQALTFNKIAPIEAGRIDIRYRQVECVPPADINIEVDVNTPGGGWIRMYVEVRLQSSCRGSKLVAGTVSAVAFLGVSPHLCRGWIRGSA